ncbi:hypothetical protein AZ34_00475 [Hylemonella gracilis str. Niagara R]|uniref:DUF2946 family protein n=1 Tax=Hylemonella gracilis str. Niagara R TaxID=1458275 RepID=A0A016XC61_9BURK|nr:DUF2946 family protein [Hylemonella gracilis]EYC49684.1 hypothetical protein AZ34_00475 [Hylemonella gracilis str. Niagara R]
MDDIVRQAMAKWPNVPDCYGWLGLDARGNWWMRDDRAQAAGAFDSGQPGAKGSLLRHEKLIDFIQRNYERDARGCWYFQNGPQRVFVELEATPWVWRLQQHAADTQPAGPVMPVSVRAHSGMSVECLGCLLDEAGRLYLHSSLGLGLVHTQDMSLAADLVEAGQWQPQAVQAAELPARYGFVRSPATVAA